MIPWLNKDKQFIRVSNHNFWYFNPNDKIKTLAVFLAKFQVFAYSSFYQQKYIFQEDISERHNAWWIFSSLEKHTAINFFCFIIYAWWVVHCCWLLGDAVYVHFNGLCSQEHTEIIMVKLKYLQTGIFYFYI